MPAVLDGHGTPLFLTGRIMDQSGVAIGCATLDIWQTDEDGVYEAQLVGDEIRHRGVTCARTDGCYLVRTVVPVDYPIPTDGPVGQLLAQTSISEFRLSHIHFKASAPGFKTLTTHLFDRASPHLETDVVFGTRESLLVDLEHHLAGGGPNGETIDRPFAVMRYDFVLPRQE